MIILIKDAFGKILYFPIRYHIKILPMGSYPRIMDSNNNTYELWVSYMYSDLPVSHLWIC